MNKTFYKPTYKTKNLDDPYKGDSHLCFDAKPGLFTGKKF